MELPNKPSTAYYPNLDGLRWVAFLMVFVEHAFTRLFGEIKIHNDYLNLLLNGIFHQGYQGVSLFFVLSGFLITNIILQEVKETGKFNLFKFYYRRALRIWPLYFLILTIIFFFFSFIFTIYERPVFYYFFLSNYYVLFLFRHEIPVNDMLTVTWSLSVEEQFYVIWPLLFIWVPRRFYLLIFISVILLALLFRRQQMNATVLELHSLSVISDLALGGLAAFVSLGSTRLKSMITNMPLILIMFVYFAGIICLILDVTFHFDIVTRSMPLFYTFLILEQNLASHSFFKMKNLQFSTALGKYTYGFYLFHMIPISLILWMFPQVFTTDGNYFIRFCFAVIALFTTLLLGYVSYAFYEVKFLKLKTKYPQFRNLFK